ncbi:hypothetical protein [Abiotrophia defectiva]|jgi:hypothetical protein|uniref:hypothetical protein n=1 Tax=Abiotrophia defectiva TaxID=46125 RepID=UPI0028E845D8|nr:hypothetical protein [Abiotrophia defectiva]
MDNLAKLRRQQAIMTSMNALSAKITQYTQLITEFWQVINQSNLEIAKASQSMNRLNSSPITSEIVVEDVFEGVAATTLASKLPLGKDQLKAHQDKMHELVSGIQDQITLLENYIADLNNSMADLQRQLLSLD